MKTEEYESMPDIDRDIRLVDIRLRAMIEQSDGQWLRKYADHHAAIINGRYNCIFADINGCKMRNNQ